MRAPEKSATVLGERITSMPTTLPLRAPVQRGMRTARIHALEAAILIAAALLFAGVTHDVQAGPEIVVRGLASGLPPQIAFPCELLGP